MKNILKKKIKRLKTGQETEEEFLEFIEHFPYRNMGDIKLDFHRKFRRGLPEAIYGGGKTVTQLERIIKTMSEVDENILITRINAEKYENLKRLCPGIIYHDRARIITLNKEPIQRFNHPILVVSAGASDEDVSEEAYISARYLGNPVEKEYDVGVACINRILDLRSRLNEYSVIIVVAGMEGALPSVVAGLTSTPIIAVPTSVGYGSNLKGISALLAMLNSCSGGVSVVNIDNGFGAAYQASLINQKLSTLGTK